MKKLVTSFKKFAEAKNIDHPTFIRTLEDVLRTAIESEFGTSENFHIVINAKGDLQILRYKEIVANDSEYADDEDKITLSEAQKIEPDFNIGEEVSEEIDYHTTFGRRAINKGLNQLKKSIQEIEQQSLYQRYKAYEGELIYAEVYHMTPKFVILHDTEKNELFLPKENQIPNEKYRKGSHIHAIIQDVTIHHNKLRITLSRISTRFLEKTLENQIDEIGEGIVKIVKIVRRAGQKAKVIVTTEDDRIDAVGACVGNGGQRIKNISRELWNEQIDVINYTDNQEMLIKKALAPAQVHTIQNNEDRIAVYLKPEQVALAIGVGGQNIELASQLVGKPIDIYKELTPGQPMLLEELTEEISPEVIQKLHTINIYTINDLVKIPKTTLQKKINLTPTQLDKLYDHIIPQYNTPKHKDAI